MIKNKSSNNNLLEIKVVSTAQASLIHAKIFIIDDKYAIIGSANFTEDSFVDLPEYIIIHEDKNEVNQITDDFFYLWNKYRNELFPSKIKRIRNFAKKFRSN